MFHTPIQSIPLGTCYIKPSDKASFSCTPTAHCVYGLTAEQVKVVVDFTSFKDFKAQTQYSLVDFQSLIGLPNIYPRNVKNIAIHPNYNTNTNVNDIALLFLNTPVTRVVTRIALNSNSKIPSDNQMLKAIGVGSTLGEGKLSRDLLEVNLPKVNDQI
jgi:Trypsin